jgi:menaquinone-dependent protoporphyrinogen oxidase
VKTLIIFASKYGGTKVSAEKIAKEMKIPETNQVQICELEKDSLPDMNQFDCLIIGGPVFAGTLHKSLALFVKENMDFLLSKKLGIFLAGLQMDEGEKLFSANFPDALLKHATAKEMIGGICDPKTLNFFFKLLMRAITKTSNYYSTVSEEKIKSFTKTLKANA